ncbi:MAG: hypothetical protein J7559_01245 [Cohnella sp.]|nr:hypothetical protein [Cohnella sp.]
MRKSLLGLLLALFVSLMASCTSNAVQEQSQSSPKDNGWGPYFRSLEQLIDASDTIVEVRKTENEEVSEERYVPGTLSEAEVLQVIKGEGKLIGKKINVLHIVDAKADRLILFLRSRESDYGSDAYAEFSSGEGRLMIDENDRVYFDDDAETLLAKEFKDFSLDDAITKIKSAMMEEQSRRQ